jgi:hypothetical protein
MELWSSLRFRQINRQLTLMWALLFLSIAPLHVAACVIDTRRGNTIFNWLVRRFLVVWAVKRT